MDGEQIGKTLAFVAGDYRDWPWACGWCGSEEVERIIDRDALRCWSCKRETSMYLAAEYRHERASREVTGQPVRPVYPLERER